MNIYGRIEGRGVALIRFLLWLAIALVGFRLVAVSLWQLPDPAFHRGVLLAVVSAFLAFRYPGKGMVWLLLLLPFLFATEWLGYWIPLIDFEVNVAAFVVAWTLRQLLFNRQFFYSSSLVEWLAEIFAIMVIISMGLGASYPSIANSCDLFFSAPLDYPLSEFEWINLGQFMLLGCAFFRIAAQQFQAPSYSPDRAVKILLALLLICFGFSLCQFLFKRPAPFSSEGLGLFSPFQSIHMAGAFTLALMSLFLPLAFAGGKGLGKRIVAVVALGLSVLLVLVSLAKSAWVGLLVCLSSFLFYRLGWRWFVGLIVGVLLLAVGVRSFLAASHSVDTMGEKRLRNFVMVEDWSHQSNNQQRLSLYANARTIIAGHPLSGIGLGQFRRMQQYLGRVDENIYSDVGVWKVPHDTHNQLLQISAEMGLPAALLLLLIIALAAWNGLVSAGDPNPAVALRFGAALAILGLSTFSLFESSLTWRGANVVFWMLVALAVFPSPPGAGGGWRAPRWLVPATLAIPLLSLVAAICAHGSLAATPQFFGFSNWGMEPSPGNFYVLRETRFPVSEELASKAIAISLPPVCLPGTESKIRYRLNDNPPIEASVRDGQSVAIPVSGIVQPGQARGIVEILSDNIFSDSALKAGVEKRPYSLSIRKLPVQP